MIKYIIAYFIFTYFINLVITVYLFKYETELLFSKKFKKDINPIMMFSIFWGFSFITFPIFILTIIKEKIMELIKNDK